MIRQFHDAAGENVVRFDHGDTMIFDKTGYSNPAFFAAFSEPDMRKFMRLQLMPRAIGFSKLRFLERDWP